jgi:hypothetical protein
MRSWVTCGSKPCLRSLARPRRGLDGKKDNEEAAMFPSNSNSSGNFDKITELNNGIGASLENYIAARTAIRDYVISIDEKYYAQVEHRVAVATEALAGVEPLVDEEETRGTMQKLRESIQSWGLIAQQVRDAFVAYHAIESKVLASFDTLVHRGSVLLQTNAAHATEVILDVQTANVAITGYVLKSEERLAENAQRAIGWAKEKIDRLLQSEGQASPALQSFSTNLDVCADSLREAVTSRKNAYHLFHDVLAPMGVRTQTDFEVFRQQMVDAQRNISKKE